MSGIIRFEVIGEVWSVESASWDAHIMTSCAEQRLKVSHPVENNIISHNTKRYLSVIPTCQPAVLGLNYACDLIGVRVFIALPYLQTDVNKVASDA